MDEDGGGSNAYILYIGGWKKDRFAVIDYYRFLMAQQISTMQGVCCATDEWMLGSGAKVEGRSTLLLKRDAVVRLMIQ